MEFRSEPRPADIEAVRAIVAATGFFKDFEVDVAVELVEERLEVGLASGYRFLFADDGEKTIGYSCFGEIACTTGSFDLFWIAVHPEHQGSGLGRRLLRASEQAIAELDGRAVWVETSSQELYLPTQAFYERCGYELSARLPDFYAVGDDKLVYLKRVSAVQKAK